MIKEVFSHYRVVKKRLDKLEEELHNYEELTLKKFIDLWNEICICRLSLNKMHNIIKRTHYNNPLG